MLRLLMRNAGAVVSREQLIDEVWDVNWFGPTKTLDVHVSGLRKKLGDDPAAPRYLHTVRGVGFRFASSDELDAADSRHEPARPAAGRVRVRARARDRGARGPARAEPLAARRRRGQERGRSGAQLVADSAAGRLDRARELERLLRTAAARPRRARDRHRPRRAAWWPTPPGRGCGAPTTGAGPRSRPRSPGAPRRARATATRSARTCCSPPCRWCATAARWAPCVSPRASRRSSPRCATTSSP